MTNKNAVAANQLEEFGQIQFPWFKAPGCYQGPGYKRSQCQAAKPQRFSILGKVLTSRQRRRRRSRWMPKRQLLLGLPNEKGTT